MPNVLSPLKVPKWPFLGGWGLLLGFGAFLALTADRPVNSLTIVGALLCGIFAVVAAMIPWVLELISQGTVERQQSAQAEQTLQFVVTRLEQALDRIKMAEDEAAKSILVARQVPERIEQKQAALLDILALRESAEQKQLRAEIAQLQEEVRALRALDPAALQRLGEAAEKIAEFAGVSAGTDGNLEKFAEKLAALLQEATQHKILLGGISQTVRKLEQLVGLWSAETTPSPQLIGEALKPLEDKLEKISDSLLRLEEEIKNTGGNQPALASKTPQVPDLSVPATVLSPVASLETSSEERRKLRPANDDQQPSLFPEDSQPGRVQLVVDAMIGITNKLYLRGSGGGLHWEQGVLMDVVGIGRWQWSLDGVKEPIECQVYRNDTDPAKEGKITLVPGQVVTFRPHF